MVEYLDCSANVVARGAHVVKKGQQTRLYFEAYGDPTRVGEPDKGSDPNRRKLDLRAVSAVRFKRSDRPEIRFESEDGDVYWYTIRSRIEDFLGNEHVLARQEGETLELVGVNVAFAVPDNRVMTPHLENDEEKKDE